MHSHEEEHHHAHHHVHPEANGKRLVMVIILNIIITIAQIAGGLISGSLALLSDALHNASDVIAVIISWIAIVLSGKKASDKATYGYKRAEILAALFNAIVLVAISLFLFIEAGKRLFTSTQINSNLMIIIAIIGLVGNMLSAFLLHAGAEDSLNVRSSYLHMFTDGLTSLGVIVGGIAIKYTGASWIDPLLTFIIGLYVLKEAASIISETVHILMQGAPQEPEPDEVKKIIESTYPIASIHHMHLWMLNDREIHFDCHMKLQQDIHISDADALRNNVAHILKEEFGIAHATIQMEFQPCDDESLIRQTGQNKASADEEAD